MAGVRGEIPNLTFSDLLTRYEREVSRHKKGARWESVRITMLQRDALAQEKLRTLGSVQVAAWRDRRLEAVSGPSVRREWNLLSHACNIAVKEWKWLTVNPFREVRRPKSNRPRDRLITDGELKRLQKRATTPMRKVTYRALLFAIETGMRASEICGLTKEAINGSVARLEDTKNGTAREVPLSLQAIKLVGEDSPPFPISTGTLDATFRDMREEAKITGLHFHDSRHTACTRLSRKLNMLQLQRVLGIKDPRILATYYNETAADIAKLL